MDGAGHTLLGLSGSLRVASTNTALLAAARRLAPEAGLRIDLYDGLRSLPPFDADLDQPDSILPLAVRILRAKVRDSDGLLIACPEYAHGVPGVFKNALDWLVSGPEFLGKPIALFNATTRGAHARAALIEILTTMSGLVVADAMISVPLVGRLVDAAAILADPDHARTIRSGLQRFRAALEIRHVNPITAGGGKGT